MKKEKDINITEISERISKIIATLSVTHNFFAKKLGYDRSQTIYDIVNGKSAPSYDFFRRFQLSEYSEIIDIDWLLTGRGDMLKKNNRLESNSDNECSKCKEKERIILQMDKTNRAQEITITSLQEQLKALKQPVCEKPEEQPEEQTKKVG